ncbi:MAG: hypothetical protein V4508_13305 [Pseudomonadota bacterium]
MLTSNHPSKQLVRQYLERRTRAVGPPPTPEEIRRQLGWNLMAPDCKLLGGRS